MGNEVNFEELEKKIGYSFKDKELLKEALTHKSCKGKYNNERLEFLGDAVLDLIVGEFLYKKFPKLPEGDLSKLRASLVNEEGFEKLAKLIDLGKFVQISQAEENNNGRKKASILANTFEAIIGAIYLEVGLQKPRQIATKLIDKAYPKIDLDSIFQDYKTILQEITQARFGKIPEYRVIKSTGPDHNKEFTVEVKVDDKILGIAVGKSKKQAEKKVAQIAIGILK